MKKLLLTSVLSLCLAAFGRAQNGTASQDSKPAAQRWEYHFVENSEMQLELARRLGWTKKTEAGEIIDETKEFAEMFKRRGEIDQFTLDKFNGLGAEGWQFSGCLGKDNNTLVFRRPKA